MKRKTAAAVITMAAIMLAMTACGKQQTGYVEPTDTIVETEATVQAAAPKDTDAADTKEPVTSEITETEPAVSETTNTEEFQTDIVNAEPQVTELTGEDMTLYAQPAYTFTDADAVMYAKTSVNVRSLPDTTGTKLGTLALNQEVTVTGSCTETGWYRIAYNDAEAYVSNKYLTETKTEAPVAVAPAALAQEQAQEQYVAASNQSIIRDGFDLSTPEGIQAWLAAGHTASEITAEDPNIQQHDYSKDPRVFYRAAAEYNFALVNEERVANGIPALIWSEDLYEIAMQRCIENDIHAGMRPGTSENCIQNAGVYESDEETGRSAYEGWKGSPGHHENYLRSTYTYGAVAISTGGVQSNAYQVFQ